VRASVEEDDAERENDHVQNVYANFEVSDDLLHRLSG
jgi:hypothetical protein